MLPPSNVKNTGTTEPPYRGDIIVDACVFLQLITDIPKEKQHEDGVVPRKFLDILPFLAKNGYRIIIPEMISYETANIMVSGADITNFHESKKKYSYSTLKPFLKDAILPETSPHKEHPNIEVISGTGPKEVDEFCDSMQRIAKNYTARIEGIRRKSIKDTHVNYAEKLGRREAEYEIKDAEKQLGNYDGDDAIISLLDTKSKQSNNKLLVVLTDDTGLKNRIAKKFSNVNAVTTTNLIYGVSRAGLGEDLGFPKTHTIEEIEIKRRVDFGKIAGERFISDKLHQNEDSYIANIDSQPFTKSLAELAEDLKRQKEEPIELKNINAGVEDRVAKFLAREAKRAKSNGDARLGR
jgi:rRNA-processing protein FCF1